MATDKCACGNEKEGWQQMCRQCYAKNGKKASFGNKDKDIKRQVFMKIASDQIKTKEPKDLVSYAQKLEKEFNLWV